MHGEDTNNWQRLHVTVALEWARPQSCEWAVSVQSVDAATTAVTHNDNSALPHLGCVIVAVDDTYAVCHLEVCSHAARALLLACLRIPRPARSARMLQLRADTTGTRFRRRLQRIRGAP